MSSAMINTILGLTTLLPESFAWRADSFAAWFCDGEVSCAAAVSNLATAQEEKKKRTAATARCNHRYLKGCCVDPIPLQVLGIEQHVSRNTISPTA